jgi:hypothetical protein
MVILGVLLSVLLPAFRVAALRSYQTDSFANIRGLYVAAQLYHQDHGDWCWSNERWCYVEQGYYNGPMASKVAPPLWDTADLDTGERVKWMPYDHYEVNLDPESWRNPTDFFGRHMENNTLNWECFDHRGQEWPTVVDPSFAVEKIARQARSQTYLYARMDGSLHTSKERVADPHPCELFGQQLGTWSGLP